MSARRRIGIAALATPENGGVFQYAQAVIDALQDQKNSKFEFVIFFAHEGVNARGLEAHRLSFARHSLRAQLQMGSAVLLGHGAPQMIEEADRRPLQSVDAFFSPSVLPYPQLFFDKPYVATIHDLQERHFPEFFTASERLQRRLTNRAVARRARRILCESTFVKEDIERFTGERAAKIDVVPAPPPREVMGERPSPAQVEEARLRHGLKGDYVFYPAQAWPHKNHLALVRAFALVAKKTPQLQLVLSGGKPAHYAVVEREIDRLALRDRIVHLGYLPYADLRAIFRGARALVVPTLFESISIPVYEAFALGVPVCLSNVVGLPEQAGDAALFFDAKDPQQIASAIERLLGDAALAQTLIALGSSRLVQLESIPYGDRLEKVLGEAFPELL